MSNVRNQAKAHTQIGLKMKSKRNDAITKVLNDSRLGEIPISYTVHYTAERVMIIFGNLPGQHKEAFMELISKQTNNRWIESKNIAQITDAKLVIGSPDAITSLIERLEKENIKIDA